MSQSLTRKNFSDIVLDPTTIAVVGSIAIHAIFAANLAFFTQPSKELKKPDPGTVKVVELTPSELQRIPQAPKPVATPIPSQQVLPPVYQPSTPAPPIVATAPDTIPLSPTPVTPAAKSPVIRIPPKPKVVTKPPQPKKDQKAIPQAIPEPPDFNPNFTFPTEPKPITTPDKPKVAKKPSSQPSPTPPKNKPITTKKPPKTQRQIDGEQQDDRKPSKPSAPPGEPSVTIDVPTPGTKTATGTTVTPPPTEKPRGDENGANTYGKYSETVRARLAEYEKLYPGIVERSGKPRDLTIPYPVGTVCPKSSQKPFIVLMVVFGKVTAQDPALGSETSGVTVGKPYVAFDKDTPENKKLGEIAAAKAAEAASTADQSRDQKFKDKEFLYNYKVRFDPKSCK